MFDTLSWHKKSDFIGRL